MTELQNRPGAARRWRALLAGFLLTAGLAACGSDGNDEIFQGDGEATSDDEGAAGGDNELSQAEENEVIAAYEEFLAVSDAARLGDADAIEQLAGMAAPEVVAQIDAWRTENEGVVDDGFDFADWVSVANVEEVTSSGDAVQLEDCVEAHKTPTNDISNNGRIDFMDQQVTLVPSGDGWRVEKLDIRNDGTVRSASEGLSCVPEYHAERLRSSVPELVAGMYRLMERPDTATEEDVEAVFAESSLPSAMQLVESLSAQGWGASGPEEVVSMKMLGSDTVGWHTFHVRVCSAFPDGRRAVSLATGEELEPGPGVPDPAAPGSFMERTLQVRFTEQDGELIDRVVDDFDVDEDSDCGEGTS